MLAKEFKSGQQHIVKAISEDKNKKTKFFEKVKKPQEISTLCKVHGSLNVICDGLFPELEEFTKEACDEERRLLLSDGDWKGMRDGLKQISKILDRIPIFDQRQCNSVKSAIGCGSGSADINAILRDFNVFPKGAWKQNNNWNRNQVNEEGEEEPTTQQPKWRNKNKKQT
eukprot:GHVR01026894.1.p2 GENE.GHVR01026894.1~~GHVR01026894.1.p2  ORF type:complete len:170 (-),score=16.03 GHVR01026894.1:633-1142(-)